MFYKAGSKSEALQLALEDPKWSENEKKALTNILKCVEIEEENRTIMASDEWQNNPIDLEYKIPKNVFRGTWVNGEDLYTCFHQKYMIEDAGTGYRIGKCYPDPDLVENVLTAVEAARLWKRDKSTIKKACQHGRFTPEEARKSGGAWLVTIEGMERLYGPRPTGQKEARHGRIP